MKNTTVKKTLILFAALLLCATLVLAACSKKPFTPVADPGNGEADGNGGIAVKYGEWLYYINGYTSDVSAENTYSDVTGAPRVGSVVRIKLAELDKLFDIQDDKNKTSTEKSDEIAQYVRDHAETVVPRIYYSGNTTTTQFAGLYIFGDRLYITTPNDELTAGGDKQTSQLVLMSYKLNGSDEQRHFTFTSNSVQICFAEVNGKLVATYLMDSKLCTLDVASGSSSEVTVNGEDKAPKADNVYNSVNWDVAGKCVFFIDKYYGICKLNFGSDKYDVIVPNDSYEIHEHDGETHVEAGEISYTINSVNNGQVYYTVADSDNSSVSGTVLYYAEQAVTGGNHKVALNTSSLTGLRAWKDGKMVFSKSITSGGSTYYGIFVTQDADGTQSPVAILNPAYNDSSVTIDRIEGDILYYTANSISYKLNIEKAQQEADTPQTGEPYARSLGSAAGWAAPDFVDNGDTHYVITATSGGVLTVVRFDPNEPNKTQSSVSILLTAQPAEEDAD